MGKTVVVAQVPKQTESVTALNLLAKLCYYYPQYKLHEARKLPDVHVRLLLKVARRELAQERMILTQIAAAPQTKNGSLVKELLNVFKEQSK